MTSATPGAVPPLAAPGSGPGRNQTPAGRLEGPPAVDAAPGPATGGHQVPDAYVVTGNQGEQTMQAGNAVSANVAHWLGRALAEVL